MEENKKLQYVEKVLDFFFNFGERVLPLIPKLLLYTGTFMLLSMTIYMFDMEYSFRWSNRLMIAVICLGFYAVIKKMKD